MNKDLLKGITIFTLMVALAIMTSVVSANAQSQTAGKLVQSTYETIVVAAVPR